MPNIVYYVTYDDEGHTLFLGVYTSTKLAIAAVNKFIETRCWEDKTLNEWVGGADKIWTDFDLDGGGAFSIDFIELDVHTF